MSTTNWLFFSCYSENVLEQSSFVVEFFGFDGKIGWIVDRNPNTNVKISFSKKTSHHTGKLSH